jgi:uncharacterized protein (DUF983 family)
LTFAPFIAISNILAALTHKCDLSCDGFQQCGFLCPQIEKSMLEGTKMYSILKLKCPRCHEGDLFMTRNPYNFTKLETLHDACPVCKQNYCPEPGFFYGAMYVSYALTIALSVAVFVMMTLLWHFDVLWYLGLNALAIILLFPPIFRVSRATWFNMFVSYKTPEERAASAQEKA